MPKPDEPEVRFFDHVVQRQPDFRVWVSQLRACGWALLEREAELGQLGHARYLFMATKAEPDWPQIHRYNAVVRARVYDGKWHFKVEGEDGWTGRGVGGDGTDEGILDAAGVLLRRERRMRAREYDLTLRRE